MMATRMVQHSLNVLYFISELLNDFWLRFQPTLNIVELPFVLCAPLRWAGTSDILQSRICGCPFIMFLATDNCADSCLTTLLCSFRLSVACSFLFHSILVVKFLLAHVLVVKKIIIIITEVTWFYAISTCFVAVLLS